MTPNGKDSNFAQVVFLLFEIEIENLELHNKFLKNEIGQGIRGRVSA